MLVDYARTRITTPEGIIQPARFVFRAGAYAVWLEDRSTRSATRILFGTNAVFDRKPTARVPSELTLEDGTVLLVQQRPGGGCGCKSALKGKSADDLLAPDVVSLP